jgi:WD40 repeat protein
MDVTPRDHADSPTPLSNAAAPAPEQIGRYRILERVGAGGMGTVYKAFDPQLRRVVALKVPRLAADEADRPDLVRRFLREARAAAPIRHPHVCPIHDVGEQEGRPYVVMAYVEGQSLAEWLRGGRRYDDAAAAVRLAREVAAALGAVHAHGLVHRDLKPANILLDQEGRSVLTDFGLARSETDAERLTADGQVVGTPAFMAPEQAAGDADRIGPWTDLYSLGVVLYRLLTGRLPFEGTGVNVLWKIGNETPPAPRSLRPDLDPALEAIVVKAMATRPEERYALAADFDAALSHWHTQSRMPAAATGADQPLTADFTPREPPAELPQTPPRSAGSATQREGPLAPPVSTVPTGSEAPAGRRRLVVLAAFVFVFGALLIWLVVSGLEDDGNGPDPGKPPKPGGVAIVPDPVERPAGTPLSAMALAVRPALVAGTRGWTVETRDPRGPVRAVAYNPDGSRLAAAGDDGTVRVWEAGTLRLVRAMVGHDGAVRTAAWSPGGDYLASGGDDGTVRLWEAHTGRLLRTLRGHTGAVHAVAWSPDGTTLASGSQDTTVRRWEVADGRPQGPLLDHPQPVLAVAWSPDGKTLATAGRDKTVWLWETTSGRLLRPLAEHGFPRVNALAWSPDGKVLASAGQDGTVRRWDSAGKPLPPITPGLPVFALAWSPRGGRLATGTIKGVQTWEASGQLRHTLRGHEGSALGIAWTTDGVTLASAGLDGTVRVWEDADGKPAGLIRGHPAGSAAVAWAPGAYELAVSGFEDSRLLLWDTARARLRPLARRAGPVAAWSPDGKTLAFAAPAGAFALWDAADRFPSPLRGHDHDVVSLAWSSDGKRLASGSADGTARVWDMPEGKAHPPLKSNEGSVFAVAWSPGDKTLGLGTFGELLLWDVGAPKPARVLAGHGGAVRAAAWSADGRMLATAEGTGEGRIFLWKAPLDQPLHRLPGHEGGAFALAWLSDARTLASGGADGRVRLWKADVGQPLADLGRHGGAVRALAWSSVADSLASGGDDGVVRLWQPKAGRPGPILVPLRAGQAVIVSPDGHWACSPGSEGHLLYVVETDGGQELLTIADFARTYHWENDPRRACLTDK